MSDEAKIASPRVTDWRHVGVPMPEELREVVRQKAFENKRPMAVEIRRVLADAYGLTNFVDTSRSA
jgi:Arc-like DNA binding domain